RIVADVGKHGEALGDELPGRDQRLLVVGEERLLVADDLQLDERRLPELAGQPRRADRLVGAVAAGRVGQERQRAHVDRLQNRRLAGDDPAQRDRHHLGARARDGLARLVDRLVLPGPDDEPRAERPSGQGPRIFHLYPPPTKPTTSSWSPAARSVRSYSLRGTTSWLRSTATRPACALSSTSSAATVVPRFTDRAAPFTRIAISSIVVRSLGVWAGRPPRRTLAFAKVCNNPDIAATAPGPIVSAIAEDHTYDPHGIQLAQEALRMGGDMSLGILTTKLAPNPAFVLVEQARVRAT